MSLNDSLRGSATTITAVHNIPFVGGKGKVSFPGAVHDELVLISIKVCKRILCDVYVLPRVPS
jgi:hypothetical protein